MLEKRFSLGPYCAEALARLGLVKKGPWEIRARQDTRRRHPAVADDPSAQVVLSWVALALEGHLKAWVTWMNSG